MAAIRSNNAACLASVERPLSLPIARKLPFRFRPNLAIDRMAAFEIAGPGSGLAETHPKRLHNPSIPPP
jgi:hypothetical protein